MRPEGEKPCRRGLEGGSGGGGRGGREAPLQWGMRPARAGGVGGEKERDGEEGGEMEESSDRAPGSPRAQSLGSVQAAAIVTPKSFCNV